MCTKKWGSRFLSSTFYPLNYNGWFEVVHLKHLFSIILVELQKEVYFDFQIKNKSWDAIIFFFIDASNKLKIMSKEYENLVFH